MNEKDLYLIKRRKNSIILKEIAKAVGCSQSLISQYERGHCEMDKLKVEKYRKYIDEVVSE